MFLVIMNINFTFLIFKFVDGVLLKFMKEEPNNNRGRDKIYSTLSVLIFESKRRIFSNVEEKLG